MKSSENAFWLETAQTAIVKKMGSHVRLRIYETMPLLNNIAVLRQKKALKESTISNNDESIPSARAHHRETIL